MSSEDANSSAEIVDADKAEATSDASSSINFIRFNQDCSSIAVGTENGYKLFAVSSLDLF